MPVLSSFCTCIAHDSHEDGGKRAVGTSSKSTKWREKMTEGKDPVFSLQDP